MHILQNLYLSTSKNSSINSGLILKNFSSLLPLHRLIQAELTKTLSHITYRLSLFMLKVCQLFSEGSINRSLFFIFFRYPDSVYRLVLHLTQFQSQLIVENTEDSSKFYPNPSALQLTLIFFNRLGVDKSYQKEQTIHLKRLS